MADHNAPRRLILASRSPRRGKLLRMAGFAFAQVDPPFADPPQPADARGEGAAAVAIQLAGEKAVSVGDLSGCDDAVALGADTICIAADGRLLGQPASVDEARQMILGFLNCAHDVVTGIALAAGGKVLATLADRAAVHFGALDDDQLQAYLAGGQWRGKAGGYNLVDRQDAGWPIRVSGDPTTVVGLPMLRLVPLLAKHGVHPGAPR